MSGKKSDRQRTDISSCPTDLPTITYGYAQVLLAPAGGRSKPKVVDLGANLCFHCSTSCIAVRPETGPGLRLSS